MYKKLKTALYANDIDQQYLSKRLGRCAKYISERMTGRRPWVLDDVYAICDLLEIPYTEIGEYFPKGGKANA